MLANFAGEEGFVIGSTERRPTLTSETHGMTFHQLVLIAHDVSDLVPPKWESRSPSNPKDQPGEKMSNPYKAPRSQGQR